MIYHLFNEEVQSTPTTVQRTYLLERLLTFFIFKNKLRDFLVHIPPSYP